MTSESFEKNTTNDHLSVTLNLNNTLLQHVTILLLQYYVLPIIYS